jgi:protein-tyrosine-phosphatase
MAAPNPDPHSLPDALPGVLFVCKGNICRSPMAKALLKHKLAQANLSNRLRVDAAGTGGWHAGELPDKRARKTLETHQVPVDHRARQLKRSDFTKFQHILVMDEENLQGVHYILGANPTQARIRLLRTHDPAWDANQAPEGTLPPPVPDPYNSDEAAFEEVFAMLDRSIDGLLASLRAAYGW